MCLIDSLMCLQVQGLETLATSQVPHYVVGEKDVCINSQY